MSNYRLWRDIQNYPVVDGWRTAPDGWRAKIGKEAKIGNWAKIGNRAKIGDWAQIGDEAQIGYWATMPIIVYFRKWTINQYLPGQVRVGCAVGTYQSFYDRSPKTWKSKGYMDDERDECLAILHALESLDPFVWEAKA